MITPELVARVKVKLKANRAVYDHFFKTIDDPAWIRPLMNAGFFKSPDQAIEQDGYIRFPFWPESQYLLRMVEKAPQDVLVALQTISPTTNQRVNEDIVQILLKLDSAKAVKFTDKVVGYLETPYWLRIQNFAAELAAKFARERHFKAAIKIAGTLLDVQPDPKFEGMTKEERQYALLQPQIKYRDYDYQEILKKLTPALAEADPVATIDFFGDLLDKSIKYKLHSSEEIDDEGAWEDYSTIWRPDIAGTGKRYDSQPRNGLVSAMRDTVTALVASSLDDSEKVIILQDLCTNKKLKVYKRIVEYVLRDHKDKSAFKPMYSALFKELKPITDPAVLSQDPNEFTPSAGITSDELAKLTDDEFIEKLKSYAPPEHFFWRDAMDGLVTSLMLDDPKRFIRLASRILKTKHQYVNALFTAAERKVDSLDEEDINGVLEVAGKLLSQDKPDESNKENRYYEWTKMSIARLLNNLVGQRDDRSERVSIKQIDAVFKLNLVLCRDPAPTSEHEETYGGDNMDPATLSINTTRGEAMHTLCRLILWAKRNKAPKKILDKVYQELSWHLDKKNDPSLAIRAVYGQWLPWIWHSNKEWTQQNLEKIFTPDDAYASAAWDAYITLNQVYNNTFELLEPIIRQRIGDLKDYKDGEKTRRDARSQFAQHIMVYYWRGITDLKDGSVTKEFFENANVHYRSEAIRFVGFELEKGSPPDEETLHRLIELWEDRLRVGAKRPKENAEELEQFGSWFAAGVFDDDWALSKLQEVLALAHNADPDFMVLERLNELAQAHPLETMKCLKEMIAGAREAWAFDSWQDNAINILKIAFNSSINEARELAKEQANLLVARGYHSFRDAIK